MTPYILISALLSVAEVMNFIQLNLYSFEQLYSLLFMTNQNVYDILILWELDFFFPMLMEFLLFISIIILVYSDEYLEYIDTIYN